MSGGAYLRLTKRDLCTGPSIARGTLKASTRQNPNKALGIGRLTSTWSRWRLWLHTVDGETVYVIEEIFLGTVEHERSLRGVR